MPELWNRSARLTFGILGEEVIEGVVIDSAFATSGYSIPQIEFDISKSIKTKNKAAIIVYNLGRSNREIISKAKKNELFCELSVGYENDNFTVFKGNVQLAHNEWTGKEWKSSFKVVDGLNIKKKNLFNKSYAPKTDIKKMLKDALSNLEDDVKGVFTDIKTEVTENGITLSGAVPMVLDKLMNLVPDQNLEMTVQDNTIYIKPVTSLIAANSIPVIAYDTGTIGYPVKTEEGVKFKALLRKGLSPGRGVRIATIAGELDGVYSIQKTKFKGKIRSKNEWYAECEAKALKGFDIVRVQ